VTGAARETEGSIETVNIHDVYRRIHRTFRAKRMRAFCESFSVTPETTVLDVGGFAAHWENAPVRPRLTILNLCSAPAGTPPDVEWVQGSALALPFEDKSFDIAYSNSVIEHVGDYRAQERFAREVQRVGRRYYVQTPNKYFPIEPHYLGLFTQFWPRRVAVPLIRYATLRGLIERLDQKEIEEMLNEIRLLAPPEFLSFFPGATLIRERVGPFTKSLMVAG